MLPARPSCQDDQFSSARFSISSSTENCSSISSNSSRFSSSGSSSQGSSSSSSSGGRCRGAEVSYCSVENTIPPQEGAVCCLAVFEDKLLSGCSDSQIFVWGQHNAANGISSQLCKFGQGDGAVKALAASKFGDIIFSAHQDNKIRVWNKKQQQDNKAVQYKLSARLPTICDKFKKCILPRNYVRVRRNRSCLWIQHSDAVSCLALEEKEVESGGGLIYSCSWDRTVKVWRVADFRCLESFKAHDDAINAVVTRNGYVYTGSADSKVKVWTRNHKRKHILVAVLSDTHLQCSVNALAFSSDGRLLYAAMSDSTIAAWEIQDHQQVEGHGEQVQDQSEHMKLVARLRGHRRSVLCLGVAGQLLCSGSADASVRIWKHKSCVAVLWAHTAPVKCLSIAAQAENAFRIYSGGLDKRIKTWSVLVEEKEEDSYHNQA